MKLYKETFLISSLFLSGCSSDSDPAGIGSSGPEDSSSEGDSESSGESGGENESGSGEDSESDSSESETETGGVMPGEDAWSDIIIDGDSACALERNSGSVTCWSSCEEPMWGSWWDAESPFSEIERSAGPLALDLSGAPMGISEFIPQGISGMRQLTSSFHSCALGEESNPVCWGKFNDAGEQDLPSDLSLDQIVAGPGTTFGLKDGEILTWGIVPAPASTGDWTAICSGQEGASCGIKDGLIDCWGEGDIEIPSILAVECKVFDSTICGRSQEGVIRCFDDVLGDFIAPVGPSDRFDTFRDGSGCSVSGPAIECWGNPCLENPPSLE